MTDIKCPYCEFKPGDKNTAIYWKIVGIKSHIWFKHKKRIGHGELKKLYKIS